MYGHYCSTCPGGQRRLGQGAAGICYPPEATPQNWLCWTSLRPSSSDGQLSGVTETRTLAKGSPSREAPEERTRRPVRADGAVGRPQLRTPPSSAGTEPNACT